MTEQREPPLLSDKEILKAIQKVYNRPDLLVEYISEQDRVVARTQREADIKWMKENCYLKAKEKLPKCKPVSIYPKNAYKEAQLDMLKKVKGVSFKAVREFKED